MQKLETQDYTPAFALEDVSEVIAVDQLMRRMEGGGDLNVDMAAFLGKVIDREMFPEQQPFTNEDARTVLSAMMWLNAHREPEDTLVPTIEEMLLQHHDPSRRGRVLGMQQAHEEMLVMIGEPPAVSKFRPLRAWRAESANVDTAAHNLGKL